MKEDYDFAALDSMISFNYKPELMEKVISFGSEYVSDCVHDFYYYENLSVKKIAELLNHTETSVLYWMDKWGMERRCFKNGK